MGKDHVVLPADAAASSDVQTFGSAFPGRFLPGEPVAVADLGLTSEEAEAAIASLGLPLQMVEVVTLDADPKPRRAARRTDDGEAEG